MKLTKEKHVISYYQLNLTYEELNVIYHSLSNYCGFIDSIIHQHIGIRMTTGETKLYKSANDLCKMLREVEPSLYGDLSFEDDFIDEYDDCDDLPFA